MDRETIIALRGYAAIYGSLSCLPIQFFLRTTHGIPHNVVIEVLSASKPPIETLDWLHQEAGAGSGESTLQAD